MRLVLAALLAMTILPAQAGPVVYACSWGGHTARLNFTDHSAVYRGENLTLDEGIMFGFKAADGRVSFDIAVAVDDIRDKRPQTIKGTVEPNIPVTCSLAS